MAFEKFTNIPWYLQLLILAVVAGLLVVGVEAVYFRDMSTKIDDQKSQLDSLKKDLEKLAGVEKRHSDFKATNARLEQQLAGLRTVLPNDRDTDVLIKQFQEIASRSNVRLLHLLAKPVTKRETSSPQEAPAKKGEAPQPRLYNEISFTLELSGSYAGMGMFFDRIGHLPRIVNVSDLAIATATNPGKVHLKTAPAKGTTDTIVASCTATAYFTSEE
ncbi:MAG: type 4a pilus biogenesis protein PilO [Acidobacteriia bacterium]|nr:type 4a pilus biogenesis protein PilO [Terriglobia bacterium]